MGCNKKGANTTVSQSKLERKKKATQIESNQKLNKNKTKSNQKQIKSKSNQIKNKSNQNTAPLQRYATACIHSRPLRSHQSIRNTSLHGDKFGLMLLLERAIVWLGHLGACTEICSCLQA